MSRFYLSLFVAFNDDLKSRCIHLPVEREDTFSNLKARLEKKSGLVQAKQHWYKHSTSLSSYPDSQIAIDVCEFFDIHTRSHLVVRESAMAELDLVKSFVPNCTDHNLFRILQQVDRYWREILCNTLQRLSISSIHDTLQLTKEQLKDEWLLDRIASTFLLLCTEELQLIATSTQQLPRLPMSFLDVVQQFGSSYSRLIKHHSFVEISQSFLYGVQLETVIQISLVACESLRKNGIEIPSRFKSLFCKASKHTVLGLPNRVRVLCSKLDLTSYQHILTETSNKMTDVYIISFDVNGRLERFNPFLRIITNLCELLLHETENTALILTGIGFSGQIATMAALVLGNPNITCITFGMPPIHPLCHSKKLDHLDSLEMVRKNFIHLTHPKDVYSDHLARLYALRNYVKQDLHSNQSLRACDMMFPDEEVDEEETLVAVIAARSRVELPIPHSMGTHYLLPENSTYSYQHLLMKSFYSLGIEEGEEYISVDNSNDWNVVPTSEYAILHTKGSTAYLELPSCKNHQFIVSVYCGKLVFYWDHNFPYFKIRKESLKSLDENSEILIQGLFNTVTVPLKISDVIRVVPRYRPLHTLNLEDLYRRGKFIQEHISKIPSTFNEPIKSRLKLALQKFETKFRIGSLLSQDSLNLSLCNIDYIGSRSYLGTEWFSENACKIFKRNHCPHHYTYIQNIRICGWLAGLPQYVGLPELEITHWETKLIEHHQNPTIQIVHELREIQLAITLIGIGGLKNAGKTMLLGKTFGITSRGEESLHYQGMGSTNDIQFYDHPSLTETFIVDLPAPNSSWDRACDNAKYAFTCKMDVVLWAIRGDYNPYNNLDRKFIQQFRKDNITCLLCFTSIERMGYKRTLEEHKHILISKTLEDQVLTVFSPTMQTISTSLDCVFISCDTSFSAQYPKVIQPFKDIQSWITEKYLPTTATALEL